MEGDNRNPRSHNDGFPEFIMADPPSPRGDEGKRAAEWLLLTCLNQSDPNILGLRKVDEEIDGRALPVVHIAIPLNYSRKQLAQALGISQLEDTQRTKRFNIMVSTGRDKPLSYVRVPASFLISRVLGAMKKQLMRLTWPGDHALQTVRQPVRADRLVLPDQIEANNRLRLAVKEALEARSISIEPYQIEILTHRETGEKWVRIVNVDRGRRTMLRLTLKRAGLNALLALDDAAPNADWSIRFPATEVTRLARRSSDSFDVHADHTSTIGPQGKGIMGSSETGARQFVRLSSIGTSTASPDSARDRQLPESGLNRALDHAIARTRSVS
jgi:hypothetical protein